MSLHQTSRGRPSLAYALLEPGRTMFELGQLALSHPFLRRAGRGDGHSVMVLPGFLGTDASTVPLRYYLDAWGYDAHGWDAGRNMGPGKDGLVESHLEQRLESLFSSSGQPISLIGWSLGGVFARELARSFPDRVRQVITLGSPIGGHPKLTSIWRIYETATDTSLDSDDIRERMESIVRPVPGIPCTAIYSRSDGIVPWHIAREEPGPLAENIRVKVSHIGLGVSSTVLLTIADRLSQIPGAWRAYEPRACYRGLLNLQ